MLQKIHDKVHGVIAWVILSFIALTFILWGINYYIDAYSHNAANTIAEVNGEKIDSYTFLMTYERLKHEEMARQGANFNGSVAYAQQLKQHTLQLLTLNQVLLQAAKRLGFFVSKLQTESILTQFPEFQEDGKFSQEKFSQTLRAASYTPDAFLQQIYSSMLINQQHFAFAATAFVLPNDVDNYVKLVEQTRDYSYILIAAQKFNDHVKLSDAQLQQYYAQHKNDFKTQEQLSIQYLELSVPQLLAQISVTPAELKSYYDDNKDTFTKPANYQLAHILIKLPNNPSQAQIDAAAKKAADIVQQLHHGKKFADLAKQYSDDVLSAKQGGVMPTITAGTLDAEFDQAMLQLKQPGQYSEPVRTKYGYEILNLISYMPAQQFTFDQVKDQIATSLKNEKAQQLFAKNSDLLTNITYQNPDSLESAAKQLHLTIQQTPLFTRAGLPDGVANNKKVVQAAFNEDVLVQKNNSALLQISDDAVIVLRMQRFIPQTVRPFAEVKTIISQILTAQQARHTLAIFGKKLQQKLNQQQTITDMLTPLQLSWIDVHAAKRNLVGKLSAVNNFVFSLSHPLADKSPSFAGLALANGDYVVVNLKQVNDGKPADITREQRKNYDNEIEAIMGNTDYNLYVQNLMKRAKIKDF